MTRGSTPRDFDATLRRSTMRSSPPIVKYCIRWATRRGRRDFGYLFKQDSVDRRLQ